MTEQRDKEASFAEKLRERYKLNAVDAKVLARKLLSEVEAERIGGEATP